MLWTSQLILGVDEMDREHKELVEAVDRLYQAMMKGNGKSVVKETIDFLGDYVVTHFKHEEALQKKYSYPKMKEHQQIHRDFMVSFSQLKDKIDHSEVNSKLAIEVNKAAIDWLKNHIGKEDRLLSEFILEQRAKK